MGVKSVEEFVFRKFPRVCPYCRESPLVEAKCKKVKGTASTVDHNAVNDFYRTEFTNRSARLNDWQEIFANIFSHGITENGRSTIALMEDLGELAEAVRVFDVHPQYFLGEAADIFSYIMGIASEHALREQQEERNFSLNENSC